MSTHKGISVGERFDRRDGIHEGDFVLVQAAVIKPATTAALFLESDDGWFFPLSVIESMHRKADGASDVGERRKGGA